MTDKKCENKKENMRECPCDSPCHRKGMCCECIKYHREHGGYPACLE